MFTNYTALAFLLPDGKSESSLQLAPNLKCCPRCSKNKQVAEFHSKGRGRHEKLCKLCSNNKKTKIRKEKRKRNKKIPNRTYNLSSSEVVGQLDNNIIEDFGKAYGTVIQEVLNETE